MFEAALVAVMTVASAALLPDSNPWLFALPLVVALALAGCRIWRWGDSLFPTLRISAIRGRSLGIRASWAPTRARAPP